MNIETLKYNKQAARYEITLTLGIDEELFRRALFRYVEENRIDPTDLETWGKAVQTVAQAGRWLSHPHAHILQAVENVVPAAQEEPVTEPLPPSPPTPKEEEEIGVTSQQPHLSKSLTEEEKQELRERALALPVDQWDTLLTPLPAGPKALKSPYYNRRHSEKRILKELERELQPVEDTRVSAIAQALNGNRIQ